MLSLVSSLRCAVLWNDKFNLSSDVFGALISSRKFEVCKNKILVVWVVAVLIPWLSFIPPIIDFPIKLLSAFEAAKYIIKITNTCWFFS